MKNFTFKYEDDTIIIMYKGVEVWGDYFAQDEITQDDDTNFTALVIAEAIECATLEKDNYFYKKIDNNKEVEKILEKIVNSKELFEELKKEYSNYLTQLKNELSKVHQK